eukprot:GHVN01050320.1.p2 GENE.GHVN01050320.1~~GHVN01050320.1.p2  ORF type:complete len:377 (+),score=45.57 GHVN01050320.1:2104-3234(+)
MCDCDDGCEVVASPRLDNDVKPQPAKPDRARQPDGHYVCFKCKKARATVWSREKACQSCFSEQFMAKFKKSLKQDGNVRNDDDICVLLEPEFFGTHVLLDLLVKSALPKEIAERGGRNERRLGATFSRCLYVTRTGDEGVDHPFLARYRQLAALHGVSLVPLSFDKEARDLIGRKGAQQTKLQGVLRIMRERQLAKYCKSLPHPVVVVTSRCAEDNTTGVFRLLSTGGGVHIEGVARVREMITGSGSNLISPMGEFTRKEISLYAHFNRLYECGAPDFPLLLEPFSPGGFNTGPLDSLLADFVVSTVSSLPNASHIVNRSAEKVQPRPTVDKNSVCIFCYGWRDHLSTDSFHLTKAQKQVRWVHGMIIPGLWTSIK